MELSKLERLLLDSPEPQTIVAISGMPGVGKSYLADHFARAHEARFAGGVLRLILNPEDERSAEALAEELANKLEPKAHPKELPARVDNALLVIENIDSANQVRVVASLLGLLPRYRVIASGRVRSFGAQAGWQQLPLDRLDEPTALELFAAWGCRPSSTAEREALVGLAHGLGFLPLALALAAGYIDAGGTVAGFEQELRETRLGLPPDDSAVLADDDQAARRIIRSSFEISLRVFEREVGAAARRALAAMGAALPQEFGESLGRAAAQLDEPEFRRLCMTAIRLSLLERTASPISPRFKFHPLISEFLRNEFDDAEEAFARLRTWFEPRILGSESREELIAEQASFVAWLERTPDVLALELSGLYEAFGDANGPYLTFANLHERASNAATIPRSRSLALGRLAHVLRYAGEYERSLEVALSKADLCGDGDPRGRALALGQVADVLIARGDFDESLRILRHELLPTFERLNDVHSRAVALGKVTKILFARGDLDEALHIRTDKELSVYERLGDVHSRAVTLGKVADISFARGDIDEALRIRTDEELPVYERLGEVRSLLVARVNLAVYLAGRMREGDLRQAIELLEYSIEQARALRLHEIPQLESFLADLRSRGAD